MRSARPWCGTGRTPLLVGAAYAVPSAALVLTDPTRPDPTRGLALALAVGVLARMSQPPAAARHHDEPDRVTEATR
jgi:hypothetical protein